MFLGGLVVCTQGTGMTPQKWRKKKWRKKNLSREKINTYTKRISIILPPPFWANGSPLCDGPRRSSQRFGRKTLQPSARSMLCVCISVNSVSSYARLIDLLPLSNWSLAQWALPLRAAISNQSMAFQMILQILKLLVESTGSKIEPFSLFHRYCILLEVRKII